MYLYYSVGTAILKTKSGEREHAADNHIYYVPIQYT